MGGSNGTQGYGGDVTVQVTGGSIVAGVDDDTYAVFTQSVAAYALAQTDQQLAVTYDIDFSVPDNRNELVCNEREMADFLQRLYELAELEDLLLSYANAGGVDPYSQ